MRTVAITLALTLAAIEEPAAAQSADEVRAVQFALDNIPRYRPGPVDGIVGPRTSGALDRYTASRPLDGAFWSVAAHLGALVWWQRPWSDEAQMAVDLALARMTASGKPPRVKQPKLFQMDGAAAACVQVSVKGGIRWLHLPLQAVTRLAPDGTARPGWRARAPSAVPQRTADLWCSLGFIPGRH